MAHPLSRRSFDASLRFLRRVSWFKAVLLVLLCLPAAFVAHDFVAGALGARPLNNAIHLIGNWTLKLILLSLAITPASRLLNLPRLMLVRRMIGVTAFSYALGHFTLYMADQSFDLAKVATEIALRFYLTIGFVALLVLAAMAATSTDGMVRRLGGRRWRRLHRLVYGAGLLAVIHFFLQTKASTDEPWVMAGIFAFLMLWRAAGRARGTPGRMPDWWPPALAVLAALITAGGEALLFWIKLGASPGMVLASNLMADLFPRPAAIVAMICLPFALAPLVRRAVRRRAPA